MSATQEDLALRRAQLVARSDQIRGQLARDYRRFAIPVRATGAVFGLANSFRQSPLFVTALAAVLIRTPWRKLARVPQLAWRGWKVLRLLRGSAR